MKLTTLADICKAIADGKRLQYRIANTNGKLANGSYWM